MPADGLDFHSRYAGAKSDVQDADYQHYGFWLKKTTKDGATTYNEVETFADSEDDASGRNVDSVERHRIL